MTDINQKADSSPSPLTSFLVSVKIDKLLNYMEDKSNWIINNSFEIVSPDTVGSGESKLLSISIHENIFSPFMYGHIDVIDKDNWIGQLNLNGSELLTIEFGFYDTEETVTLQFFVCSQKIINNFASYASIKDTTEEKVIVYRLEFISEEIFNNVFNKSLLEFDEDFVGYIAKETSIFDSAIGLLQQGGGGIASFAANVAFEQRDEIPGLVNVIAEKLNLSPIEIEGTKNGIWLKSSEISFPSGVAQGQISVPKLMTYITNYALPKDNTRAPNFFFWKDRDGWHFKSLESILKSNGSEKIELDLNSDDLADKKRIISIRVIKQNDQLSLFQDNAFMSHYVRIKPDYSNVYSDFLSSKSGFTYSVVDYNYHRDFSDISHVEEYKLISDTVDTDPIKVSLLNQEKVPKPATLLKDNIYGFYETKTYNTPFASNPPLSKDTQQDQEVVWWDYLDREKDSRWTNNTWQPQFDSTELEIKTLYNIYKKIRIPLKEKRKEFVRLKNLKRQWEVYRCVVCCAENTFGNVEDILTFFNPLALIANLAETAVEYAFLFGKEGIFSDSQQEYKIVAAGSFTDVIDYDSKDEEIQHGLTLSVNLDNLNYQIPEGVSPNDYTPNDWYASTIGQFYNMKNEIPDYVSGVLTRGTNQYDKEISKIDGKILEANAFLSAVDSYITEADNWINSRILDCCEPLENETTPIGSQAEVAFRSMLLAGSSGGDGGPCPPEYTFMGTCSGGQNGCINACCYDANPNYPPCSTLSELYEQSCENVGNVWSDAGNGPCGSGGGAGGGGGGGGGEEVPPCNTNNEPTLWNGLELCGCNDNPSIGSQGDTCKVCPLLEQSSSAPSNSLVSLGSNPTPEQIANYYAICFGSTTTTGACCKDCGILNQLSGDNCSCTDNSTFDDCYSYAIEIFGEPNRTTWFRGLSCDAINNCSITGPTGNYNLCQEGTTACLRQGCTDTLTGSVFNREPASCIGFNYVDGLGRVPLITLPQGKCIKCNNFSTSALDIEFDDSNCCNCTLEQATTYSPLPQWASLCSKNKFMKTLVQYIGTEGRWYNEYRFEPGGSSAFTDIDDYIGPNGDPETTRRCLENGDCYNTLCFNPLYLEVEKRRAIEELKILNAEKSLLIYARDIFASEFITKFNENYQEWWNRKAFFYSKIPGKNVFTDISTEIEGSIDGGRAQPITASKKSLFNIKSIKKKQIRGSRYELLAKNKGITGGEIGEWLYNFFWNNTTNETQGTNHPYYSQKYQTRFVSQRQLFKTYNYNEDVNKLNNFPFVSEFAPTCGENSNIELSGYLSIPHQQMIGSGFSSSFLEISNTQTDIPASVTSQSFQNTFNLFNINPQSIPPNLKKEQLSSYVRIEFTKPIGLDRIVDFPDGFIRDAGTEYFLPYLVSLTPGPTGRQTIRNNVAVIGMDPYGFDVAVKKSKVDDEETEKQYGWWDEYRNLNDTSLTNNGMELWPEVGFETTFPYYAADPKGWWWKSSWYHGDADVDLLQKGNNNYDWYTRSADVDPEYKESAHASGYLQYSHRKVKPHRSWWSFHIPKNIFIPQKLFHMLSTKFAEIDGESSGVLGDIFAHKYKDYYWWYGDEVDRWLRLTPAGKSFVESFGLKLLSVLSNTNNLPLANHAEVHSPNSLGALNAYFHKTTMHWMFGDFMLYRPSLIPEDVWKYDLTGETDYGLVSPKTMSPNHDVFDDNFSAQFVVFSRQIPNICGKLKCANPDGYISNDECGPENPYCNCPAQEHIPDEPEPSYLELFKKYLDIKECDLIESVLGEEYIGCLWSDPTNPCSCDCPNQGEKFKEYLEYSRTYATFWDTPDATPLIRKALISQIGAQQITISIPPTSVVKVGDIIKIKQLNPDPNMAVSEKNLHGRWLISEINMSFYKDSNCTQDLTLIRDTLPVSPDYTTTALEKLLSYLF